MHKKLVANAVVNSLTAILGCRNGALFRDEASKRMLQDICTEAAAVFKRSWKLTQRPFSVRVLQM